MYSLDQDFSEEYACCEKIAHDKFFRHDGFLFPENKLCVPNCSIREESRDGGLIRYFGVAKIRGFERTFLLASHEEGC